MTVGGETGPTSVAASTGSGSNRPKGVVVLEQPREARPSGPYRCPLSNEGTWSCS